MLGDVSMPAETPEGGDAAQPAEAANEAADEAADDQLDDDAFFEDEANFLAPPAWIAESLGNEVTTKVTALGAGPWPLGPPLDTLVSEAIDGEDEKKDSGDGAGTPPRTPVDKFENPTGMDDLIPEGDNAEEKEDRDANASNADASNADASNAVGESKKSTREVAQRPGYVDTTHAALEKKCRRKVRKMFKAMDSDHDGVITKEDLIQFYAKAGSDPEDPDVKKQLNEQFAMVDVNGDGQISWSEFEKLQVPVTMTSEKNMQAAKDAWSVV